MNTSQARKIYNDELYRHLLTIKKGYVVCYNDDIDKSITDTIYKSITNYVMDSLKLRLNFTGMWGLFLLCKHPEIDVYHLLRRAFTQDDNTL